MTTTLEAPKRQAAGERAYQLKLHRQGLLAEGSRNLTIYAAAKLWTQLTRLQRDRKITVSNSGAVAGDELTISREGDHSCYDLLVGDARGHLATLTATACTAVLAFSAAHGWRVVRLVRAKVPVYVDRQLAPDELAIIQEVRGVPWPAGEPTALEAAPL